MKHYPFENVCLYTSLHFPIVSNQKSIALFDNCLVYSVSLVSNNYLGSNNCSVENNFHLLVNVLFTFALLFRLLLCETLFSLECVSFTLHIIFPFVPLRKSCALRENCLVYITSLVSNNYLGSHNCSVENNFHLLVISFFLLLISLDYCLYETLSSWEFLSLHFTSFSPGSYSEKQCFVR